jgi:uncharacterized repeat protein (TIGR03803 family)
MAQSKRIHRPISVRKKARVTAAIEMMESRQLLSATLSTLLSFNNTNGGLPQGNLIADSAGNLYGTTYFGGSSGDGTVFEVAAGTHKLTTLVSFNGSDGANPYSGLIADAAGNLYGTTVMGGPAGEGTVYEISAGSHKLSTLVNFNGSNGEFPYTALTIDAAGNLYGTTAGIEFSADGAVYEIAAGSHTFSSLVTFDGSDGEFPTGLTADAAGNLYGTTSTGGLFRDGTVFEITAGDHTLSTLVNFNGNLGADPEAAPVFDSAGNLYGTTFSGGSSDQGTVYKISARTHAFNSLTSFNGIDGENADSSLLIDGAGNLFGTTQGSTDGSTANGSGTAFEIPAGKVAPITLVKFHDSNGAETTKAGLVADSAGNLFGTTYAGGSDRFGTVYEITGSGYALPVKPSITLTAPVNQTATAGWAKKLALGSFSVKGPSGPYAVEVNWGDGSILRKFKATIAGLITGEFHTFGNAGTDTVSVTITDAGGGISNVATFKVIVAPPPEATITGTVFNDANGDKKPDDGELGLGGYTVFIDRQGTGQYAAGDPTALTAYNGSFSFTGLTAGTYRIAIEPMPGVITTTSRELMIKLKSGQFSTGNLFGEKAIVRVELPIKKIRT